MHDGIDEEGATQVELYLSLCALHARITFAIAENTWTDAVTLPRSFGPSVADALGLIANG